MPVFAQAMAKRNARRERVVDEDAGPVADEGEDLLEVDLDGEEEEEGSLPDEADFSTDEEDDEEEEDDNDEVAIDSDDDEASVAAPAPAEAEEEDPAVTAAVSVEFSEPKAWVERMTLSATKPLPAELDANDDPNREAVFMKHALLSVRRGVAMLERAGVKWRRPEDYYAEMFKSDVHMDKVRSSLEKTRKEVQERAHRRNMREQKKFGKEVQADVLRQRAQQKNEQLAKLNAWRKQKGSKASLDEVLDGDDGDDRDALTAGRGKKGGRGGSKRDAFRQPGRGGAAKRGGARSLRPGAKAGKKASKRPGKNKRR